MNCRAEYYRIGESKTLIAGLQNKRHSLQSKWHSYRITLQHRQRPPVSHCSSSSAELAGMVFRREDRARGILAGFERPMLPNCNSETPAAGLQFRDPCSRIAVPRPLQPDCRVQSASDPCCRIAVPRPLLPECRMQSASDPCSQTAMQSQSQSAGIGSQARASAGKSWDPIAPDAQAQAQAQA